MKKSYELDPSINVMAPVTIFICNRYSKNYDEAIKWYYISISHPLCNQNLKKLLDGWYEEVKNEKGSNTNNYQNNKVNVNTLIEQGSSYYKAENYKLAIQKFEEALKNISTPTKEHATMYYELGDSYLKVAVNNEEYYKVIETMKKSYKLDPSINVMAPVTNFICYRNLKKYEDALVWYYLSIAHPLCKQNLRKLLDGWYDEVLQEIENSKVNINTTDLNQQILKANELFESKQYALAIPKYEAILNGISVKTKEHAALYYKLGYSYFNVANDVSEYNDVISLLKKSYDLDPNYNCMVPATFFICYKQLKNKEAAIIWYYVSIANSLCNQKQKDLLLEYYNEMLKN